MRKNTKRAVVVAAGIGLFAATGIAFAAWTSDGSGTGQVASTTSVNSTITPADGGSLLYPGGSTNFTVTINNPNDYGVAVTGISAGSSNLVGTCAAGTVTSVAVTNPGTIAANDSQTFTLNATMASTATDGCKSQSFTLPLTATLASN